jgi:two-component system response regulator VicR
MEIASGRPEVGGLDGETDGADRKLHGRRGKIRAVVGGRNDRVGTQVGLAREMAPDLPPMVRRTPSGVSGAVDAGEYSVQTGEPVLPPILVVDDNHDNAEIIRQYLEIRGYPISVAHNGDEALALYETVKPALVLLDVMMPGRDGWEVCRLMKQHPTLGHKVRIIMVTALDAWDDKREALQLGADDYVEKPFDLPTLAKTVQRNLDQIRVAS